MTPCRCASVHSVATCNMHQVYGSCSCCSTNSPTSCTHNRHTGTRHIHAMFMAHDQAHTLTLDQKLACLPWPQLLLQRLVERTRRAAEPPAASSPSSSPAAAGPGASAAAAAAAPDAPRLPAASGRSRRCCSLSLPLLPGFCCGGGGMLSRRCMRGRGGREGGGDCSPANELAGSSCPTASGLASPTASSSASTSAC